MSLHHRQPRVPLWKLAFAIVLSQLHHHSRALLSMFILVICIWQRFMLHWCKIKHYHIQFLSLCVFDVLFMLWHYLVSLPLEKKDYFFYLNTSHFIKRDLLHHTTTIDATVAAISPATPLTPHPSLPLPICTSTPSPIGVRNNSSKGRWGLCNTHYINSLLVSFKNFPFMQILGSKCEFGFGWYLRELDFFQALYMLLYPHVRL